ncbi:hypothetical protein [Mycobacterium sp. NPDC050041]|uniref:hypothetical protein n=1 Tax=Mycobacterium sp. NPDC050041 TaxID=3364293 RepID=UPI003C2DEED5
MDNTLGLFDQAFFTGERVTGATGLLQTVWVYDRAIDLDGVRRFHHHLQRGRISRLIERSPLPFGRYRWVAADTHSELEIVATPRPREEFDAWLREQAGTPLDAEHGPAWHLAVLPFTDGGAGVSLLISHSLTDGVGLFRALADAACGRDDTIAWPAAGSRPRWRAVREDARQTARDVPAIGRAIVTAARMARRARTGGQGSAAAQTTAPPAQFTGDDEAITLSTATVFIDAADWDARAESLGGTSNSLLAAVAAGLARRAGRITADGAVTVGMPVNERTPDDTRANAVTNVDFTVDPALATTELRAIRAATKQAITQRDANPDERWVLLPLVPLIPRWLLKRMAGVAAGAATGVVASNLGEVDPDVYRPDGTAADSFVIKSNCPGMTRSLMHRTGGMMAMLAGRVGGRIFLSVAGYQPGRTNSNAEVRRQLADTLSDFSLTGVDTSPAPAAR